MSAPVIIGRATLYLGDCRDVLPRVFCAAKKPCNHEYWSEGSTVQGSGTCAICGLNINHKPDAIVTDPPYGLGKRLGGGSWGGQFEWEREIQAVADLVLSLPTYADSIIWGGNYYNLPPTRGWLSWFKPDAPPSMANFELAWTSFDANARQLSVSIAETNPERCGHPTQKPLRLMKWCIAQIKPNPAIILDPFMGSGTTGVAAVQMGRSFIGIEREEKYFQIACRRIEEAQRQGDFFIEGQAA